MSDDLTPNNLPSDQFPYGVDTIRLRISWPAAPASRGYNGRMWRMRPLRGWTGGARQDAPAADAVTADRDGLAAASPGHAPTAPEQGQVVPANQAVEGGGPASELLAAFRALRAGALQGRGPMTAQTGTSSPSGNTGTHTPHPGDAAGPQTADGAANLQVLSHDQRTQQAVSYFQHQGWTRQQAIGIVANLDAESGMDPNIHQRGGGPGYGLAQWESPRQRIFQRWASHDVHSSTFEEQLQFVQYELTHVRPGAGRALRHATTAADAASIVTRLYEGPNDVEGEAVRRAERARQIEARIGR